MGIRTSLIDHSEYRRILSPFVEQDVRPVVGQYCILGAPAYMLVIAAKPQISDFHVCNIMTALKGAVMVDSTEEVVHDFWFRTWSVSRVRLFRHSSNFTPVWKYEKVSEAAYDTTVFGCGLTSGADAVPC